MMRSLLCVGVPRDAGIDFPENGFTSQGHAHNNSPDFTPSTAAGRMRTAGRRLSLQISSRLAGRGTAEPTGDESGAGAGTKLRRNSKRSSLGGISKKNIGHPEGFRHEQHVGFPGVTQGSAEVNWDLEKWREQLEASMKTKGSTGSTAYSSTQAVRPKGPRSGSISRARPPSMDALTPTTQAGSYSQPNLHFSSQPTSAPQPLASVSSVASLPANAGSAVGLSRSFSASGSGGVNPPRRKPVPAHLPVMTEVSPFPTLAADPTSAPPGIIPFAAQQQQPQEQGRGSLPPPPPPPHAQEGNVDMVDGGAGVKLKKEMVPLLGVPEGRVVGHEAHYVTTTTKARWDGAMSEIAKALKDIDVES